MKYGFILRSIIIAFNEPSEWLDELYQLLLKSGVLSGPPDFSSAEVPGGRGGRRGSLGER